jgi:SPP1 family predicted phage head-tail adaptor
MRQRITIVHAPDDVEGSMGYATGDWDSASTSGPFWAEVRAMQGRELEASQQTWAEARFKVRMRYQPGVTINRKDRITWGSRTLDILDAEDPDGRKREFVMVCKEYVD